MLLKHVHSQVFQCCASLFEKKIGDGEQILAIDEQD